MPIVARVPFTGIRCWRRRSWIGRLTCPLDTADVARAPPIRERFQLRRLRSGADARRMTMRRGGELDGRLVFDGGTIRRRVVLTVWRAYLPHSSKRAIRPRAIEASLPARGASFLGATRPRFLSGRCQDDAGKPRELCPTPRTLGSGPRAPKTAASPWRRLPRQRGRRAFRHRRYGHRS
jgi:hypothetical protein